MGREPDFVAGCLILQRINLVCAALFDLVCNAEYIHGRVTNRSWIYCNRCRDNGDLRNLMRTSHSLSSVHAAVRIAD